MSRRFPCYTQLDAMDCGPTCLKMVVRHYGRTHSLQYLRQLCHLTKNGVSMLGISEAAETIGMRSQGVRINLKQLAEEAPMPCILHWNNQHFVVCYKVKVHGKHRKSSTDAYTFYIADPANGKVRLSQTEFEPRWLRKSADGSSFGTALLLEPTPAFYDNDELVAKTGQAGLGYFFRYLLPYKAQLLQLLLATSLVTFIQLLLPFLSQSMVDNGIGFGDTDLITLILIAQFVLYFTQFGMECIRGWITLHTTTRINISLVSDFLLKLMRLPLRNFDTKKIGDIMQRVGDNDRIQSFLTGQSVNVFFSLASFLVFGIILAYYNVVILLVFLTGNALYVGWVMLFLRYRRELDNRRFSQASAEQNSLIELVYGMQEIKMNNCERQKRWNWERIQARLFRISMKGLAVSQCQQSGASVLSQTTNLLISYIAARSVISGQMTLGMMTVQSYIVGQLTSPLNQFISFVQSLQDARISLERLGEVHSQKNEDASGTSLLTTMPREEDIHIRGVWFNYDGADRDYVLQDINLDIPANKTTAIVGASGSGKTTLTKLLLGFYAPNKGEIRIGSTPLESISPRTWRSHVGVVMQDGYIFSDTIAGNIAVGEEQIDWQRLREAASVANITGFVENQPLGFETKIGMEGKGLSSGQKQRILIARAVYKNPRFVFFDEATNALDTTNERQIMQQLSQFLKSRTTVVVAHRLSTVQNADNIVVINGGRIVEQGTHDNLLQKQGYYYTLVRNQLTMGC